MPDNDDLSKDLDYLSKKLKVDWSYATIERKCHH